MRALLNQTLLALSLLAIVTSGCGQAEPINMKTSTKKEVTAGPGPSATFKNLPQADEAPTAKPAGTASTLVVAAKHPVDTVVAANVAVAPKARAARSAPKADSNVAGISGADDLVLVEGGQAKADIIVSKQADKWEKNAADDLAKYIGLMTGVKPAVLNALPVPSRPAIIIGKAALEAKPALAAEAQKAGKQNPTLRSDSIVVQRDGNRVYVAGTNDDSHYYAAAWLLNQWGCRWYIPTDFGDCIPKHTSLKIGKLDHAYGSPFEVRRYWISWVGDYAGYEEFKHRNFMNNEAVPNGHSLQQYTKQQGAEHFKIAITDPKTADGIASHPALIDAFKTDKRISLGIEDGLYDSSYPLDKELLKLQYDKYFLTPSYTDCFMTLYNNVSDMMLKKFPNSKARIGFLAYANLTMPPVKVQKGASPLVVYLAPIDIDPNHGMDSPHSGPKHELKDMVYKWAKVMDGRMVIYDYDQGMLVWRDLPNPSHQAFREDVKHYAKAKILGVDTESRNAIATTFLNLYFRGQLMWNPEKDTDAMLAEFYPKFYGPAAKPMAAYWDAIFQAWDDSLITEHEYFCAPAIYTPELIAKLKSSLAEAEKIAAGVPNTPENKLFHDRMKFTRLSFGVIENYVGMVKAAATDVDYKAAVVAGKKALADREQLTTMSGIFTTYKSYGEPGYPWFPGEVKHYEELSAFTDGAKGTLVAKLPLVWQYKRDPKDVGVKEGWLTQKPDMTWWNSQSKLPLEERHHSNTTGNWEDVDTDLYLQAQGIVTEDYQSYSGHGWYRTEIDLTADQIAGNVKIKFPGVFNEFWVYVNGQQVAYRPFKGLWWLSDYKFEFDADVAGKLKAGKNVIVMRHYNPHHFGGMFRRPFLYRAK